MLWRSTSIPKASWSPARARATATASLSSIIQLDEGTRGWLGSPRRKTANDWMYQMNLSDWTGHEMGWPTGFEPATTRSTIWGSNQAELRPPADAREANFLCSQRQAIPDRTGPRLQLAKVNGLRADWSALEWDAGRDGTDGRCKEVHRNRVGKAI